MTRRWRPQGQHRRIARVEQRQDRADTDIAHLLRRMESVEAAVRVIRPAGDGEVTAELTIAIANGSPAIPLEVDGEEFIAVLDTRQPGDVIEMAQAVRRLAEDGQVAS
jgi:hypothetical protein